MGKRFMGGQSLEEFPREGLLDERPVRTMDTPSLYGVLSTHGGSGAHRLLIRYHVPAASNIICQPSSIQHLPLFSSRPRRQGQISNTLIDKEIR